MSLAHRGSPPPPSRFRSGLTAAHVRLEQSTPSPTVCSLHNSTKDVPPLHTMRTVGAKINATLTEKSKDKKTVLTKFYHLKCWTGS